MSKKKLNWYNISVFSSISVGILLIALGAYFSTISLTQLSIAYNILKLKDGFSVSDKELNDLINKQRFTANFSNDGLLLQDLGFTELTMAKRYGYFSKEGASMLDLAKNHLQDGLALSPANSYGWLRLAYINTLTEGASKDVSNAVYMSVTTSPYNYKMIYYRLSLAIISWDYFNEDNKETLLQQIRVAWRWDKKQVFNLATSENAKNIIENALLPSPEDTLEFNKMFINNSR